MSGLLSSFLECLDSSPPKGNGKARVAGISNEGAVSPAQIQGETEKGKENQVRLTCLTCLPEKPSYAEQIAEWRAAISSVRSGLPDIEKLKAVSLRFLDSPEAALALENGWDAVSLFGMYEGQAPRERIDCWGLLLFLAWGVHSCTVETVDQKVCAIRTRSGAVQTLRRSRANFDQAVPWWKHPGIRNAIDGDSDE